MLNRPEEIDNLLRIRALKEADRNEDELRQYLTVATGLLRDARNANVSAYGRYMLAYDGLHSLAIATLLHFAVRPGDQPGHRALVFQKFCDLLEMDIGMRKIVLDAHDRRNEKTYRSALPPLTHKDAEAVVSVLAEALPKVTALIAQTK